MTINERLSAMRKTMEESGLDAFIVPSTDPHQSEYVAELWESRKWISGFTGSAGVAVVTRDHAGLWTDSRYFLQADLELADSEFELHKIINQGTPEHEEWLVKHMDEGQTVGIDRAMFSAGQVEALSKRMKSKNIKVNGSHDVVGRIWTDRPSLPAEKILDHSINYAGEARIDKLNRLREQMKEKGVLMYLITTLDDIAWLFNIRGNDVSFNPVVVSYAIITLDNAVLFVDGEKISSELKSALTGDHVDIRPYGSIEKALSDINAENSILIHKASCNDLLHSAVKSPSIKHGENLVMHMKAIKNKVELAHFRDVMKKDAVALCKLYMWLESEVKNRAVPEAEVADQLASFRSDQDLYHGESFSAIVGYESNGAVVHYRPEHDTCLHIEDKGMLLLDSGGQYMDGTTDITRTISFSEPSAAQRKSYTCVLKGHIGLAQAKFPVGTIGGQLDVLARQHLWAHGLNYLHGTGHGVGFFLNVHEPPQGFAPGFSSRSKTALKAGMVTSNEPGYYEDGEYGIRIENLVVTVESGDENYLEFETITLFPIATNLIDLDLMTDNEIAWLNDYHARVLADLSPLLSSEEVAWMTSKCQLIGRQVA